MAEVRQSIADVEWYHGRGRRRVNMHGQTRVATFTASRLLAEAGAQHRRHAPNQGKRKPGAQPRRGPQERHRASTAFELWRWDMAKANRFRGVRRNLCVVGEQRADRERFSNLDADVAATYHRRAALSRLESKRARVERRRLEKATVSRGPASDGDGQPQGGGYGQPQGSRRRNLRLNACLSLPDEPLVGTEASVAQPFWDAVRVSSQACQTLPIGVESLRDQRQASRSVAASAEQRSSRTRPVPSAAAESFPKQVVYDAPCGPVCSQNKSAQEYQMYGNIVSACCRMVADLGSAADVACQDAIFAALIFKTECQDEPDVIDFLNPVVVRNRSGHHAPQKTFCLLKATGSVPVDCNGFPP